MGPKINKIILILLVFSICSCAKQEPFMDYVLSWDGKSSIVKVELTYADSQKDSTVFIFGVPDFGGQHDIFTAFKNIRVTKPETLSIDNANRRITVYHNGAKKHYLSYAIDGSLTSDKPTVASQTELFRPVITNGMLTLVNIQFTLEVIDRSNPLVSFRWREYPENFTYFNSVQPSQKNPSKKVEAHYDELSQKVYFVVGD